SSTAECAKAAQRGREREEERWEKARYLGELCESFANFAVKSLQPQSAPRQRKGRGGKERETKFQRRAAEMKKENDIRISLTKRPATTPRSRLSVWVEAATTRSIA